VPGPVPGCRDAFVDACLPRGSLNDLVIRCTGAFLLVSDTLTCRAVASDFSTPSYTMSTSSGFQAMPGWYWPDDVPKDEPTQDTSTPSSSSSQPRPAQSSAADERPQTQQGTRRKRTHWPPRQCRICLETVQPTFNVPSDNLPGFMQSSNVVYEDEGGRLIRPCLCKGSSKYVHDGCLQAWRHSDPSYGRRNYWQCPTCGFKYRLARLGAGRFVGSIGTSLSTFHGCPSNRPTAAQVALTVLIMTTMVFVLGFFADPIINLYFDPWSFLSPWSGRSQYYDLYEDEAPTWAEHFAKGFAGMGVLGFLKVLVASPFTYFRMGGGGRGRATGRDRYEQVSWIIILVGVATFLAVCIIIAQVAIHTDKRQAVYKGVRVWSRRTLERAGERVMDVQGDDDDDDE
jgi:hypothetical protein